MSDLPYNDPFYFAVPRATRDLGDALRHIARNYGIEGHAEVVRHELAFTLCRLTDLRALRKES